MNKLGVEEGEYIDSKIVTRSVEKAQKRVESMHYESRKHILEYDDIANEQRKAIYKFRNQLLDPEFDIDSKIRENRREYIEYLLNEAEIFDGTPPEDFNIPKLRELLKSRVAIDFDPDIVKGKEYSQIRELLYNMLEGAYEEKMKPLSKEQRSEVQRGSISREFLDPLMERGIYMRWMS